MPSKTAKQARFMAAIAHGWTPSSGKAPPIAVAREFAKADAARRGRAKAKRPRKRTIAEGY